MNFIGRNLFIIFLIGVINFAKAGRIPVLTVDDTTKLHNIEAYLHLFKGNADSLTIADISKVRLDSFNYAPFLFSEIDNQTNYWCTITLQGDAKIDTEWILYLSNSLQVDLYVPQGSSYQKKSSGVLHPMNTREISFDLTPRFFLEIPKGERLTLYAYCSNKDQRFPHDFIPKLENARTYYDFVQQERFSTGLFLGILIVVSLYNIFLFYFYLNRSYLYYSLHMFFIGINFIGYKGVYLFLIGDYTYPDQYSMIGLGTYIFYILFLQKFTYFDQTNRFLKTAIKWFLILDLLFYIYVCLLPALHINGIIPVSRAGYWFIDLNLIAIFLITLYLLWQRKKRHLLVSIGTTAMLVGLLLSSQALIPNADQIGIVIQILFLSAALGFRFNKKEMRRKKMREELAEQSITNYQLRNISDEKLDQLIEERINQRKKENSIIGEHNTFLAAKNKYQELFQSSINYHPKDYLHTVFPDSFALLRPKSLDGGDFYWNFEFGDLRFVAVFDSPKKSFDSKVFLSLQSNEFLFEMLKNEDSKVDLKEINHQIHMLIQSLHKSDEVTTSIVSINKKEKGLYFSGGSAPLLCLINDNIEDIKPSEDPSEVQMINIKESGTFYLMTNGMLNLNTDHHQWKNMLSFFIENADKKIEEQMLLLENVFRSQHLENDQKDDVLVVGVKF